MRVSSVFSGAMGMPPAVYCALPSWSCLGVRRKTGTTVTPTTLRISWVSSCLCAAFSWRQRSTVSRLRRIGSGNRVGETFSRSSMLSSRVK
jgi:hypothetical protein